MLFQGICAALAHYLIRREEKRLVSTSSGCNNIQGTESFKKDFLIHVICVCVCGKEIKIKIEETEGQKTREFLCATIRTVRDVR